MTMPMTSICAHVAIETLYAEHRRGVLAYLNRLMHDSATAEDLCQETFMRALQAWDRRDATRSAAAWLYRIARNAAYDELRRRRRITFLPLNDNSGQHLDERPAPEARLSEQEPVRRALAQLAPLYRQPLVLHSCDGYNVKEIGAVLGCSDSAIKARLHRARARFQRAYREYT